MMSQYTNVESIGYTNASDDTTFVVTINTTNISSNPHKTLVRYYLIKYKQIT